MPRDERLTGIQNLLARDEEIQDHGLARYEEAEGIGRGLGEGFLAVTTHQLIFSGDRTGQTIEMTYSAIERVDLKPKMMTCNLVLSMTEGDTLTFNGGKRFLGDVKRYIAVAQGKERRAK